MLDLVARSRIVAPTTLRADERCCTLVGAASRAQSQRAAIRVPFLESSADRAVRVPDHDLRRVSLSAETTSRIPSEPTPKW